MSVEINGKKVTGIKALMAEILAFFVASWAIFLAFSFIIVVLVLVFTPLWVPVLLAFLIGKAL